MPSACQDDITEFKELAYRFGAENARAKAALLERIMAAPRLGARDLGRLHDTLLFLLAYPDNAALLRLVKRFVSSMRERLESSGVDGDSAALQDLGFPGGMNRHEFSFPVIAHIVERFPECLEIDWGDCEIDSLLTILGLCVIPGEAQGLDDITLNLPDWFERTRPDSMTSDLEYLVHLFTNAPVSSATRDVLYELAEVPVRFQALADGSARNEVRWPVDRVHYQKHEFQRERHTIASQIGRPFEDARRLSVSEGKRFVDLALRALFTRNLEIRTLNYANPRDVWLVSCGRGVQMGLIGVVPAYRDPLECHTCVLLLKNGIPIGYGPATATLGCAEIGLNLFPEVRGAEVRFLYPQFLRAIHQILGPRYFYLTAYGMGEDNPAAIKTGAFWFYRKLGFSAANPEVEALAREEEEKMRANPKHRSDLRTLRRLSHTEAFFDLSEGDYRKPWLGEIGVRQSRFVAEEFGSDRALAEKRCIARAARILGEKQPSGYGWELLAPLLCMIPDLPSWSRTDKRRVASIVRAKGAAFESGLDRKICALPRLRQALLDLGED